MDVMVLDAHRNWLGKINGNVRFRDTQNAVVHHNNALISTENAVTRNRTPIPSCWLAFCDCLPIYHQFP